MAVKGVVKIITNHRSVNKLWMFHIITKKPRYNWQFFFAVFFRNQATATYYM